MKKLNSLAEAIDLLGMIRAATINLRQQQLEREARIKAIDDEFGPRIEAIQDRIQTMSKILESWAVASPSEFGAAKSIECAHGRFGFRICPPSAKCIRPFTWARVLEALERDPEMRRFIRLRKEVDRESIIAGRDEIGEKLKNFGIRIIQNEIFFVEPKLDEAEK